MNMYLVLIGPVASGRMRIIKIIQEILKEHEVFDVKLCYKQFDNAVKQSDHCLELSQQDIDKINEIGGLHLQ